MDGCKQSLDAINSLMSEAAYNKDLMMMRMIQ